VDFYDDIADSYDAMTGFDERLTAAQAFVRGVLDRGLARSAVDVACGTGLYAIPLARCGLRTVGSDLSSGMLAKAEANADERGLDVRWLQAPMEELGERLMERFDLLLCLGNSIPHVLDPDRLRTTMAGFFAVLNPGGRAFIHLLNYGRVLARQERIVEITRQGEAEYVRFYDFMENGLLRFNVLAMRWPGRECAHELHSTLLRPYRKDDLTRAMRDCGFREMEIFGSLALAPFEPDSSSVLVVSGTRPGAPEN